MEHKPKKIIVAEDDPGTQHAIAVIFERAGYEVRVIPNGQPLLENDFEVPDIFILDRQLSGVDGLDICRFLKAQEHTAAIPVIMLSASPDIGRLSVEAAATDFLEKPFRMKKLLEMVNKYA